MCGVLALLFIVVPALEIYVLIKVGGIIGALPTIGVIIATGLIGAALAKHQGFAAVRKVQQSMLEGREVGTSLVGAALVLVAAVFMVTPGFVTDVTGILLLLPPFRALVAPVVLRWGRSRFTSGVIIDPGQMGGPMGGPFPPGYGQPPADDSDDHDPPPPGVIDV